jgi:hypothetical protein
VRFAAGAGTSGSAQALTILLIYHGVFGVILGVIDVRATPTPEVPVTPETENESAAVTVPVGAVPWPHWSTFAAPIARTHARRAEDRPWSPTTEISSGMGRQGLEP